MGLFGEKKTKEEKAKEKLDAIMEKYHLTEIDPKYRSAVEDINSELSFSGTLEFGNFLAPDQKTANQIMIQYLNSLVQQNWIIIRELSDIKKELEK